MAPWLDDFSERMDTFARRHRGEPGEAVSIKIWVSSGCYHREHSPRAYQLIDNAISNSQLERGAFLEHESGPELLVLLALGTAGVTLAKSLVDLVTTIIKARSEGIRKGDRPRDPVELIVRRYDSFGGLVEERVLRISTDQPIDAEQVRKSLESGLQKVLGKEQEPKP